MTGYRSTAAKRFTARNPEHPRCLYFACKGAVGVRWLATSRRLCDEVVSLARTATRKCLHLACSATHINPAKFACTNDSSVGACHEVDDRGAIGWRCAKPTLTPMSAWTYEEISKRNAGALFIKAVFANLRAPFSAFSNVGSETVNSSPPNRATVPGANARKQRSARSLRLNPVQRDLHVFKVEGHGTTLKEIVADHTREVEAKRFSQGTARRKAPERSLPAPARTKGGARRRARSSGSRRLPPLTTLCLPQA